MARSADTKVTQEEPTAPRPVDPNGRTLDRWGLPISGPARAAALDGKTDPNVDPAGWTETPAPPLDLTTVAPDAPSQDQ